MYLAGPIQPVIKVIKEYAGKLPMACGTGGTRFYALKTLENAGVLTYFEHIVTAEDVETTNRTLKLF